MRNGFSSQDTFGLVSASGVSHMKQRLEFSAVIGVQRASSRGLDSRLDVLDLAWLLDR